MIYLVLSQSLAHQNQSIEEFFLLGKVHKGWLLLQQVAEAEQVATQSPEICLTWWRQARSITEMAENNL